MEGRAMRARGAADHEQRSPALHTGLRPAIRQPRASRRKEIPACSADFHTGDSPHSPKQPTPIRRDDSVPILSNPILIRAIRKIREPSNQCNPHSYWQARGSENRSRCVAPISISATHHARRNSQRPFGDGRHARPGRRVLEFGGSGVLEFGSSGGREL